MPAQRGENGTESVIWVIGIKFRRIKMGKYVGYLILVLIVLFAVEFFGIVDIPYFDIPDYFTGKEDMIDKTGNAIKQLE